MNTAVDAKVYEDGAGLFSMDVRTGLVYADKAVADIFGFDEGCTKKGVPRELFCERIESEFRDYVSEVIAASIESGEQIQLSYRIIRPDGSRLRVLGFGQCFRSDTGEPLHYAGIVVPLSDCDGKLGANVISHLLAAHEAALSLGSVEGARRITEAMTVILTECGALPVRH